MAGQGVLARSARAAPARTPATTFGALPLFCWPDRVLRPDLGEDVAHPMPTLQVTPMHRSLARPARRAKLSRARWRLPRRNVALSLALALGVALRVLWYACGHARVSKAKARERRGRCFLSQPADRGHPRKSGGPLKNPRDNACSRLGFGQEFGCSGSDVVAGADFGVPSRSGGARTEQLAIPGIKLNTHAGARNTEIRPIPMPERLNLGTFSIALWSSPLLTSLKNPRATHKAQPRQDKAGRDHKTCQDDRQCET